MSDTTQGTRRGRREAAPSEEETKPARASRVKTEKAPKEPKPPKSEKPAKAAKTAGAQGGERDPRPSLMLLPEAVRTDRARRTLGVRLGAGVAGVAVLGVVAIAGASALNTVATNRLDDISSTNAGLRSQVSQLQPVADYYDGLSAQTAATYAALEADVSYAAVTRAILETRPAGVTILNESTDGTVGAKCAGPNPFEPAPAIGCVAIEGTATTLNDAVAYAAAMQDYRTQLNGQEAKILVDPYVTTNSQSESTGEFSFTMTVNYDASSYSRKYIDLLPEDQREFTAPSDDADESAALAAAAAAAATEEVAQ